MPHSRDRFHDDLPGDEWMHQENVTYYTPCKRTRIEEQRHIDDLYVRGQISHDDWSRITDYLSDLMLWEPRGMVRLNKKPK